MACRWLLAVVAIATLLQQAAGQCVTDAYTGTLRASSNVLASNDKACFDTLLFSAAGCDVQVVSAVDGCDWLQLSGTLQGTAGISVPVAGPLDAAATHSTHFVLKTQGYYSYISLGFEGEDTIRVAYDVTSGRVMQIKAAGVSGDTGSTLIGVGAQEGPASQSTANCNTGAALIGRAFYSANCPSARQDPCLTTWTTSVSRCFLYVASTIDGCPRLKGSIAGGGTSAALVVETVTSSRAQSQPLRRRLRGSSSSSLVAGGRSLLQAANNNRNMVSWREGAPWTIQTTTVPNEEQLILLQSNDCDIYYRVRSGRLFDITAQPAGNNG